MIARWVVLAVAVCALTLPDAANACSVCFGDPNSPASKGLAWGVAALLGVVLLVLGAFIAFFIFLARRAATTHDALPQANSSTPV